MTDQPKTPGEMVLVPREPTEEMYQAFCDGRGRFRKSSYRDGLREAIAVGAAEQNQSRDHTEDVRAMVEQATAVGGEPDAWPVDVGGGNKVMVVMLDNHRAHVSPLLAEIEACRSIAEHNAQVVGEGLRREDQLKARIAELEAQQGELVAKLYTCAGKGGRYELLGLATGAGLSRGQDQIVYRDASTGRLFLRYESDFADRMKLMP